MAPNCANADCAVELRESAAVRLVNDNFADVKLKGNDKIISIGAATNNTIIRVHRVEVDPTSLFMRVTCTIKKRSDMEDYLKHEFSKHPLTLFDRGAMRKTDKSVLSHNLKADPISASELGHKYYVVDGGHLLHIVAWPVNCTYGDVIVNYVNFVTANYGTQCTVCFDGYSNPPSSTTVSEQNHRSDKNISPAVVFDDSPPVVNSQRCILGNRSSKSRLISKIIDSLTLKSVSSCQSQGDADYLISSIVLAHAENMTYHVVLVAKDTDLLVLLSHGSKTENAFMQYDKDHIYNIHSIKIKMNPVVLHHILLIHAISGCDTVSAVYGVGKEKGTGGVGKW